MGVPFGSALQNIDRLLRGEKARTLSGAGLVAASGCIGSYRSGVAYLVYPSLVLFAGVEGPVFKGAAMQRSWGCHNV